MELVRYKPGEAIKWLETGAQGNRKAAAAKGRSLTVPEDLGSIGRNVKTAAGALLEMGKSALTELMHKQAMATEYALGNEEFQAIKGSSTKTLRYEEVKSMSQKGDKTTLTLQQGNLTIKPYAYIVAGKLKVPIGWSRNGIEVPYELLIEELSARCGVNLEAL